MAEENVTGISLRKRSNLRGDSCTCCGYPHRDCIYSFLNAAFRGDGNLSMYYGSAGILMLGISLADFGFAIRSLFDEESFMTFPRLAVFFSLIAVISWGGTYVVGFII